MKKMGKSILSQTTRKTSRNKITSSDKWFKGEIIKFTFTSKKRPVNTYFETSIGRFDPFVEGVSSSGRIGISEGPSDNIIKLEEELYIVARRLAFAETGTKNKIFFFTKENSLIFKDIIYQLRTLTDEAKHYAKSAKHYVGKSDIEAQITVLQILDKVSPEEIKKVIDYL